MTVWRVLVLGLVAGVVAACSPVYETRYHFTPPASAEGRLCTAQCGQIQQLCRQNCRLQVAACEERERSEALHRYQDYVEKQHEKGEEVTKTVSDFTYYSGCSAYACEATCDADYRGCYQTCGGGVEAYQVCTAFCDQEPAPGAVAPAAGPSVVPPSPGPQAGAVGGRAGS